MIKDPSRKQIIVSMGNDNKTKFIALSSEHVANLNSALKNIKLDIMADFTYMDQIGIIIITNKVASPSDLQMIENYVINIKHIDSEDMEISHLL